MFTIDDEDSNGVPQSPPPAIRSDPTDKTIRAFAATITEGSGVPTAAPDAATSATALPVAVDADDASDGVPANTDDESTLAVTPLDVGYRFAALKRLAEVVTAGSRGRAEPGLGPVGPFGLPAVEVRVAVVGDQRVVIMTIRRWAAFAARIRAMAIRDFVDLKSTLGGWPDVIQSGVRHTLRRLTEECHKRHSTADDGSVSLRL